MKNIFYILAVLAVGAAAFTGWQVNDKTNNDLEVRNEWQDKNDNQSNSIDKKTKQLSDAIVARDKALKEKNLKDSELELAESNYNASLKTFDEEEARFDEQQQRAANVDKVIAQIKESIGNPNVEISDVPRIVSDLEEDKKNKDKALEELESVRATLEKAIASATAEIDRKENKISESKTRIERNKFSATVATVDNEWGFMVINAGVESGLEGNSKLLLTRNGRLLGKVLVSSLEATQSIVEVVPASLAPGVLARPGDVLILEDTAAN